MEYVVCSAFLIYIAYIFTYFIIINSNSENKCIDVHLQNTRIFETLSLRSVKSEEKVELVDLSPSLNVIGLYLSTDEIKHLNYLVICNKRVAL